MYNFRSQNLKFKHFNDNIDIDLSFFIFFYFTSTEDIIRIYNFFKFTSNIKI